MRQLTVKTRINFSIKLKQKIFQKGLEVPELKEDDMPTIGKKKPYFKGITNVAKKRII